MTEGGKRRRLKATTPSRSYVSLQCPSSGDDYQDFWSQIPSAVMCALNGDFWSQLCAFMCHLSMPWWMWAATIELICDMERSRCYWPYNVGYPEKSTADTPELFIIGAMVIVGCATRSRRIPFDRCTLLPLARPSVRVATINGKDPNVLCFHRSDQVMGKSWRIPHLQLYMCLGI